jgi:hypothetical protein
VEEDIGAVIGESVWDKSYFWAKTIQIINMWESKNSEF